MTRPFDPRLIRRVPATRRHLAALGLLGVGTAVTVIGQATALAMLLAAAAGGSFDRRAALAFGVAIAARATLGWAQGTVAAHAAATVKATLRADLLAAVGRQGAGWHSGQRAGSLATLAGRGLDALDAYFTGYLPQLVLAVTVPIAVLARLTFADWTSALIVAVTLPLLPIFGALLGWRARAATDRQWRRLSTLGGHFLDMVAGLPTLRLFGRAQAQVEAVRRMADAHRIATMRTLRIAFLSALVLELVATLGVALVAVPVGLRLLAGGLTLPTALLVLLLAPEAYLPLRSAGARFHASMEGLAALDEAFGLLDEAPPVPAARTRARVPDAARSDIRLVGVTVAYERALALRSASLLIRPGDRIAVIGPSGAGKSTLLGLLLGTVMPTSGRVLVDGTDLSTMDIAAWRRQLAWVPQRAHLFAASLAENITLGRPEATTAAIAAAADAAGLTSAIGALPAGLDTPLGERGYGVSSGERQRVALARAFMLDAPVLLLDEPTASLDGETEAIVLGATRRLAAGRTALVVAHRPAMLSIVDRVVRVEDGLIAEQTAGALT